MFLEGRKVVRYRDCQSPASIIERNAGPRIRMNSPIGKHTVPKVKERRVDPLFKSEVSAENRDLITLWMNTAIHAESSKSTAPPSAKGPVNPIFG